MTTITKELEQRLKDLESEQDQQNKAVNELSEMDEIIRNIEATLAQMDNYKVKQPKSNFKRNILDETKKLERKLAHIDEEYIVDLPNLAKDQAKPTTAGKTAQQPQKTTSPSQSSSTHGYVICLMFNPRIPQEWSGQGWCEPGKGLHYTNPEQAKQTYQKLKKQWPSYPLKIFKR